MTRAPTSLFSEAAGASSTQYLGAVESNGTAAGSFRRRSSPARSLARSPRRKKLEARWIKQHYALDRIRSPQSSKASAAKQRLSERREWEATHRKSDGKAKRDPPPDIIHATPEEIDFRHGDWKDRRVIIREAMVAAHLSPRSIEQFDHCGAYARVYKYDDAEGGYKVRCQLCHNRYCRPCGRARALLIADNLRERISNEAYLHTVLTLKHRDEPLPQQVDRLYRCFKALRKTLLWRNATDGGAAFFQAHKCQDGMWHAHLHIVNRGKWLNERDLAHEWKRITGDSDNVGVSAVRDKDAIVREVTRYASRPIDDDKVVSVEDLTELMIALRGRRLCFTFGKWRGYALTAIPIREERPTTYVESLTTIIRKAVAGETHWQQVLDVLRRRSTPSHAPPPHVVQHAEDCHYFDA